MEQNTPPRVLIAVASCHKNIDRINAIRSTWGGEKMPESCDLKYFVGDCPQGVRAIHWSDKEIVRLSAPDDYNGLPLKVRAIMDHAISGKYDYLFKVDDDTYVRPERVMAFVPKDIDLQGRLRGPSGRYPSRYVSGFAYYVSRKAMLVHTSSLHWGDIAEDRCLGVTAWLHELEVRDDARMVVIASKGVTKSSVSGNHGPTKLNAIIASAEHPPEDMRAIHGIFMESFEGGPITLPSDPELTEPEGEFDEVDIMIKTFLRDGYLFRSLAAIPHSLPGARMIVVDDGKEDRRKIQTYADLRQRGHACVWMKQFDSGFGEKANEALKYVQRPYVLIGSDDFNFTPNTVTRSVRAMLEVMREDPSIGICSGRVNKRPYEGRLTLVDGVMYEEQIDLDQPKVTSSGIQYHLCDLTVNFSLIRSELLWPKGTLKWDGGDVKIGGGEHGAFFMDAKEAGIRTAYVYGCNIDEQKPFQGATHPRYDHYRARAREGKLECLQKRGIKAWVSFDGKLSVV